METWEHHSSPMLRRLFWYYQARLRWTGKTPPDNTPDLLVSLEKDLANAEPEVQWAMNFCAGQIGVFEPKLRPRCIKLGKTLGLYKDERVPKNCTPSYLPEFIRIEVAKRLLENESRSFDEITSNVGYEDSSTFRRIFSKNTGLVPKEYRKKFQRVSAP